MHTSFTSRMGFLFALIGSAVGLGNIWKFPYLCGQNGGGVFVIFYLICVFAVAIPLLIAEISIGKCTNKPGQIALPTISGQKWLKWPGWLPLVISFIVMSFYSVVSGWVLSYFVQSVLHLFGSDIDMAGFFGRLLKDPVRLTIYHFVFMAFNGFIIWRGVRKGVERFCTVLMPVLFACMAALLVFAITEGNLWESLVFMFEPRLHEFHPDAIKTALGHAFFSVGIGFGIALTYGAYLRKTEPHVHDCLIVGVADTAIALLMGIIIFSFTSKFGVDPAAGPTLIFDTLPGIFEIMPFGKWVALIFYFSVFLACVTSSISILEVMVFHLNHKKGEKNRKRSTFLATTSAFLLGIVSILSFNVWSEAKWWRGTLFDNLDFFSSNVLLPIFGLTATVVFVKYLNKSILIESFVQQERYLLPFTHWFLKWVSIPVILVVFYFLIFK